MITSLVPSFLILFSFIIIILLLAQNSNIKTASEDKLSPEAHKKQTQVEITEETLPFLLDEIQLSIKSENYTRAEDLCNQIIGVFPENLFVLHLLATTLEQRNNPAKAEVILRNLINLQEKKQKTILSPKKSFLPTQSITKFFGKTLLFKDTYGEIPSLLHNYARLAQVLAQQKKHETQSEQPLQTSIQVYQLCLVIDPTYAPAHFALGNILHELNYPPADYINHYENAFRYNSRLLDIGLKLANTFLLLEDYAKAALTFSKVIAKNPKEATAYHGLGLAYLKQKQLVKAKVALLKAIELGTKDAALFSTLASIYYQLEEYKPAEEFYQTALELKPTAARYFKLALVQKALQKSRAALESCQKAVTLNPEKTLYQETLALWQQEKTESTNEVQS